MAFTLFIVSKSGSTVYFKKLRDDAPLIDSNEELRLGSTFHGLHAIAATLSSVPNPQTGSRCGGIEELQAESFKLRCFQSPTGMKFVLLADPETASGLMESLLKSVYVLYADYVLKDPGYDIDQPIRLTYFNLQVEKLFS